LPDTEYYCTMVGGVPVVTTPEEVDIMTAEKLRAVLLEAASGARMVVVDMTSTTFLDSSGLHVLLGAHRQALADGRELRLAVAPRGGVSRIFTLTGTDAILSCFPSLDEALAGHLAG
jgi:stage II sporulation protein AA (anti-sigma F factor antagonist)